MLTIDEMHAITKEWRPKFADVEAFETSCTRFLDMVGEPTADKLQRWLMKDLAKDTLRHAAIVREPLLPVRQKIQLVYCRHCDGKRYVRQDVDIDHPNFGKALPCPDCNR